MFLFYFAVFLMGRSSAVSISEASLETAIVC